MYLRKLEKLFSPKLYQNDYDVSTDIEEKVNMKISESKILSSSSVEMRNGESVVDNINKRRVININGVLHKESVENNNVILTKL